MSVKTPGVGSTVNVTVDSRANNGESIAPAMVTRVKNTDEGIRLNMTVFLDTGATKRYQYIPFVDSQPAEIAEFLPVKVAFWPTDS